ncbi:hypothetical protein GPECTOR_9g452 [Gonium pectorale]|uniref:VASt domain-containing protein n=1 Tax=Gonium pectorale TaxID=33097 RepID=A0A150GRP1_GONPE|nr:hypothetical protein GPECTOR_9g452 [Gonium pectorale]|eukprot:KXZ52408.1 hypothetical protein GPECTOR_9g452 [Gonium pectorale]
MRKRVLLQGRMYIFDHYVCFYSAVFGFAKKRRIPMRTIQAVRKKTHLGFPNSLEIEADERKDFYTSFLSREEAYQLMQRLVPEAKRLAEAGEGSVHEQGMEASQGTSGAGDSARQPNGGGARASRGGRNSMGGVMGGIGGAETLLTRGASGSMADENDGDDGSEEEARVWVMEQRAAPPVAPGSRHVLHGALPGSPREFFDVVLADSAPFFEDFLDGQGNRRINLTSWKRHPQLGHVRDLHFTAPIKGAFGNWGVSHTACSQTQRFCLYSDEHIVFESSQTMTDIPYGDCFTVDQRWDVRMDPQSDPDKPHVMFDLHVRVPFTSRCLFKGVIESGSVKQVQETYAQFIEQLRPVMQERLMSRNTLHLRDPSAPGAAAASTGHTPRVGSISATPRPLPSLGRLTNMPSIRASASMQRVGSMHSPRGFDDGDGAEVLPGTASGSSGLGRGGRREPGVGRLLLSLGGRLADGARGLLENSVDVVLNMTQCRTTPQMRFLCGVVLLMFLANMLCMVAYVWPGTGTGVGSAGGDPAVHVAAPPAARLAEHGGFAAGTLPGSGDVFAGGFGAADGGLGGMGGGYWAQRMAVLQQELQLLQGRLDLVLREVGQVQAHLAGATAQAAAGGDAGGSAPVTPGREL